MSVNFTIYDNPSARPAFARVSVGYGIRSILRCIAHRTGRIADFTSGLGDGVILGHFGAAHSREQPDGHGREHDHQQHDDPGGTAARAAIVGYDRGVRMGIASRRFDLGDAFLYHVRLPCSAACNGPVEPMVPARLISRLRGSPTAARAWSPFPGL